jgi:hypothetical protein
MYFATSAYEEVGGMIVMRVVKLHTLSKSRGPVEEPTLHPRVRQFIEALADLCVERDQREAASRKIDKRDGQPEAGEDAAKRRSSSS